MSAGAVILIVLACVALLPVVVPFIFLLCLVFGTEFRNGEIHECVGCRGDELKECPGCRCNPEYWDGMTYTGPSRRELNRLRKEKRENESRDM